MANNIDLILSRYPETKCAKVDREKLHLSMEAWIYVEVEESNDSDFGRFNRGKGVLTWNNSD